MSPCLFPEKSDGFAEISVIKSMLPVEGIRPMLDSIFP